MKFVFKIGNEVNFDCKLVSLKCVGTCRNGTRCKKRTVMGLPYCWMHLLSVKHLRILPSTIPQAGKGLFAMDRTQDADALIFEEGDKICEYEGQTLTNAQLNARYGDQYTAPYAYEYAHNVIIDSACRRGVGAIINHKPTDDGANVRWSVDRRNRKVNLVATEDIYNNQELFIDYGEDYAFPSPQTYTYTTK